MFANRDPRKAEGDALTNLTRLAAVYQWPPPDENSFLRQAKKDLENEGPGVVQLLNQTGETPPLVAGTGSDGLAVVTDKRTIDIRRGKIRREIVHSDVRQTRLMKHLGLAIDGFRVDPHHAADHVDGECRGRHRRPRVRPVSSVRGPQLMPSPLIRSIHR
jgi:hypothetical protein